MSESANDPALVVTRTRPDGTSTRREVTRSAAPDRVTLAAVVAGDPALDAVRRGEIVEVTVAEDVARPVEVLAMMRSVGRHAPEDPDGWPEDVAEPWAGFDAEAADQVKGSVVARWVSVNGQRATAVVADPQGSTQRARAPHLVLFTEDQDALEPLEELAEHSYDTDWGSAGGVRLNLVAPDLLQEHGWGDSAELDDLILHPGTKRGLDELVEQWVGLHVPERDLDGVDSQCLVDEPNPLLNGATLMLARRAIGENTTYHFVHRRQAKSHKALAAVLAAKPELHEVRRGELLKIAVDPAVMSLADLLALLRPVGSATAEDRAAWPEQLAEFYGQVDEVIEDLAPEIHHVARWVTINGTRATGALDLQKGQGVRLVLLDDETMAPLRTLAASSWYSEHTIGSTENVPAVWVASVREAISWWASGDPFHDIDINAAVASTGMFPDSAHPVTGADGVARIHVTASDLAVWLHLQGSDADPFPEDEYDEEM